MNAGRPPVESDYRGLVTYMDGAKGARNQSGVMYCLWCGHDEHRCDRFDQCPSGAWEKRLWILEVRQYAIYLSVPGLTIY